MPPEICPNCGAEVPARARACPECGACPETGWSERADADAAGIPDEGFDYQRFVEEEFGAPKVRPRALRWWWWAVGLVLAGLLLLGWLL